MGGREEGKSEQDGLAMLDGDHNDRYWIGGKNNKFTLLKEDFDIFIAVYQ